jgi:hypothetical protein
MENFPRSSDADISISCAPGTTQSYFPQQGGHVPQNADASIVTPQQYMGEHMSNAGMIQSVPNYAGMNNGIGGHMPNQMRSNSPNIIGTVYPLTVWLYVECSILH